MSIPKFVKPNELESGIYTGTVFHKRTVPKLHQFKYEIFLFWLKLSEVDSLCNEVTGFSKNKKGFSIVNFSRSDYLGDQAISLEDSALIRMNELADQELAGDVFMLGQIRTFGLYFSPVNFFYLRDSSGVFTHMLAEVSNTPWNKRHYYLVDMKSQQNSQKAFHVSPFNPMDMEYRWKIQQPGENVKLHLSCYKQTKHFEAAIDMHKKPLNSANLRATILTIPSMTIKTMLGIYWQAIKLFFKRVPIYSQH